MFGVCLVLMLPPMLLMGFGIVLVFFSDFFQRPCNPFLPLFRYDFLDIFSNAPDQVEQFYFLAKKSEEQNRTEKVVKKTAENHNLRE